MIKKKIKSKFRHQYDVLESFSNDIYIADYTEQSKKDKSNRSVEFSSPNEPKDISSFVVRNTPKIKISGIIFDNDSFRWETGSNTSKKQCEAVLFPYDSRDNSWILFCELKYNTKKKNNTRNLRKAMKQLCKTREYYYEENIISITNQCYLIVSLPFHTEPFSSFLLPPSKIIKMKKENNIIMRFTNFVEIQNEFIII